MAYQSGKWAVFVMCSLVCAAGCGNDKAAPKKDAGVALPPPITCGSAQCSVTAQDFSWGGQACCLDATAGTCGVKADNPKITDLNGNEVTLSAALAAAMDADGGAIIVNTHAKIPCLPKDVQGTTSAKCPGQRLDGTTVSSTSEDAGASADSLQVDGCCLADGQCGFVDNITGFGCVKVSQSIIGQALGLPDRRCD